MRFPVDLGPAYIVRVAGVAGGVTGRLGATAALGEGSARFDLDQLRINHFDFIVDHVISNILDIGRVNCEPLALAVLEVVRLIQFLHVCQLDFQVGLKSLSLGP